MYKRQAHASYVHSALSRPYILGYHRCQYIDRFTPRRDALKQGLVRADWTPYGELVELVTETNNKVLERFQTMMRAGK